MRGTRRWSSTQAICPFYKATEFQCVHCIGTDGSSLIRLSFPDKARRKVYEERFCDDAFQGCAIYQALEKKES